jgi:hypothetical protein
VIRHTEGIYYNKVDSDGLRRDRPAPRKKLRGEIERENTTFSDEHGYAIFRDPKKTRETLTVSFGKIRRKKEKTPFSR